MKTKPRVGEADTVIGQNLRTIRHIKGLSQEDLAKLIGVSFQQIQKYEQGKNRISASTLLKLSDKLKEPVNSFLYGGLSKGPYSDLQGNISRDLLEIIALLQKIPDKKIRNQLKLLLKGMVTTEKEDEKD